MTSYFRNLEINPVTPLYIQCTIFIKKFQAASLNESDGKANRIYPGLKVIKLFFMQLILA